MTTHLLSALVGALLSLLLNFIFLVVYFKFNCKHKWEHYGFYDETMYTKVTGRVEVLRCTKCGKYKHVRIF